MTIAAGFDCRDGVVLCADTKITKDSGRKYETKILPVNTAEDSYLIYCGMIDFAKELGQILRDKTKELKGSSLVEEIKNNYQEFFKQHYTEGPKRGKTWASIIFSARERNHVNLYNCDGYHCSRVEGSFASIGSGAPFAEPFLSSYYSPHLTVSEATNLAVYAFQQIKDFAPGCGGKTHVVRLVHKKSPLAWFHCDHHLDNQEIEQIEHDYNFFQVQLRELFLHFPNCDTRSPKDFSSSLRHVTSILKEYRTKKIAKYERQEKREQKNHEEQQREYEREAGL